MHAVGCTPMCINGVIDQAVVNFSAGLTDILMELAFGKAARGKRWRDCGAKLVVLAQTLKDSPPPLWVNPSVRAHDGLQSLIDHNLVTSFAVDSDDEECSFPSRDVKPTSTAGPSTGQAPPTDDTAEIVTLQNKFGDAHRSLEALTITGGMSAPLYIRASLF